MKIFLHYTIWNKGTHVPWLVNGIRQTFPYGTELDFVMDNCTDDSRQNLINCIQSITGFPSLGNYKVRVFTGTKKYRWPNTNDAIERFMQSDCDLFVSPQDDQKLQNPFLMNDLFELYRREGIDSVGIVGMRDGIDFAGKMHSSPFSTSKADHYLRPGEYRQVQIVNDGPICLSKQTVQKVGVFDTQFWAHYNDNDYCFRCESAGLKNFVMGCELVHEKWGNVQASEVWSQEFSTHDYTVYRKKWPNKP